jgi:penicillin-binding protein 1C
MNRLLLLAAIAVLATALRGGADIVTQARQSAALIAPAASRIVYDRNGAFITQIGDAKTDANGARRVEYG